VLFTGAKAISQQQFGTAVNCTVWVIRPSDWRQHKHRCRSVQDLQNRDAIAELRNLIEGHVMDKLAALEQHPTLQMLNASVGNFDAVRD